MTYRIDEYYREKEERRQKQILPLLIFTSMLALLFAIIAYSLTPQAPLPALDVEFHSDGQVSVHNPGLVPEAHVSLCVYTLQDILLEHFETPVLAGHTGVMGPSMCAFCRRVVVLGPVCDKDAQRLVIAADVPPIRVDH